jgi:TetR/AcrR family transcriptional regulator, cholesterol catabolism regulator
MSREESNDFRSGSRQEQKQLTRERVIAAAKELFVAQGYAAVTIKMIADKAGVATGTVFASHESKADLFNEVLVADLARELTMIKGAAEAYADRSVLERLTAVVRICYVFQTEQLDIARWGRSISWIRSDEAELNYRRALIGHLKVVSGILQDGIERGEVNPDADVQVLCNIIFELYAAKYRQFIYRKSTIDEAVALFVREAKLVLAGVKPAA